MARKILLADDSVTAQNMGRKILADAGYEVITVNNGSAALKRIAELKPDLIVLDVYMPGYSGLEVCQRLKETQETGRIPVLLTVGKLEPFKPEEAKRARADAYIVKPFEASELLSALTKLEDKIVPRAEGSKPGRFARSIAAIEEGRYDKSMAGEEDSGWKSRINFPAKKGKKAAEKEDGDGPAIYNAVNKDLRTTVDHSRPAETKPETKKEESRVDLGALTPAGLPKDVTPEEIAALAAAAAQVQNSFAASQETETAEAAQTAQEPKAEPVAVAKLEASTPEPQETAVAAITPAEPKAEEKSAEKIEATKAATEEATAKETPQKDAASGADEAIAAAAIVPQTNSGNGTGPYATPEQPAEEPVTMAVASGAVSTAAPRWMAVTVALAPEESAVSLETEMQKAHAAFAAAEGSSSKSSVAVLDSPTSAGAEQLKAPETSLLEPAVSPVPVKPVEDISAAADVAQTLQAVASAATEAIDAAIKQLETKNELETKSEPETKSASLESIVAESPAVVQEQKMESAIPSQEAESPTVEFGVVKAEIAESTAPQESEPEKQTFRETEAVAAIAQPSAEDSKVAEPEATHEATAAENSATATQPEASEAVAATEPVHGGSVEMGKKESEIAATTAAAWASWRRIRESGDSKPGQASKEPGEDSAAMAVAAGAEHKPEEVKSGDESDPEIANIVDSVLADMRPKIVEEISRKLGKKK